MLVNVFRQIQWILYSYNCIWMVSALCFSRVKYINGFLKNENWFLLFSIILLDYGCCINFRLLYDDMYKQEPFQQVVG